MGFQGKKNIYLCTQCGRGHVTVDLDEGTTPMFMACLHCGEQCHSLMYGCPQEMLADIPAAIEWYRPRSSELDSMSPDIQHHVQRGGLCHRPTESKNERKEK